MRQVSRDNTLVLITVTEYRPCVCKHNHSGRAKRRFQTRKDARIAAKTVGKIEKLKYRVYKCPGNEFWHITSDGQYQGR